MNKQSAPVTDHHLLKARLTNGLPDNITAITVKKWTLKCPLLWFYVVNLSDGESSTLVHFWILWDKYLALCAGLHHCICCI